jgi:hypothetical protein
VAEPAAELLPQKGEMMKARIVHAGIVRWKPNPWGVIAAGAIGSVIGRYILTLYMPHVSARIFRRWDRVPRVQSSSTMHGADD